MPRHNKQEQQFLAMKVGETRINGTNGNTEYWSGDNYGWQSENGHNEALAKEKARADSAIDKPLWDAVDNGKQALGDFIAGVPGVKEAAGAVHFVTTKVQETAEYDRTNGSNGGDYSPANIAVGVAGAWQQGVDQFANGARSNYRAVESLIENGTGVELDDRGRDAYAGVLTSVAEGVAEGGAGGLLKAAKNIPLDPPKQLALAPVAGSVQLGNASQAAQDNLGRLLNQPLEIASDLTRQGKWQAPVRELRKGDNTRQLAAFFRKGPGGKLKQNNLYVTADELAANKDGVLDKMLERADKVDKAWDRYQARGSTAAQRNLYDIASKNIFESGAMIYGKDKARDFLAKTTNWLTQDEWHHIFGNKEAGEFVLMQAAQDPLVAVNIFAKMQKLKLHSSGIAQNIALMKKGEHLDWHKFMKEEGFEPRVAGKTTAAGDFADLSAALGREIASGNADVNDIFRMLDLYSSFNKWVRKRTPGQNISDMEEGVYKALQIGGYK